MKKLHSNKICRIALISIVTAAFMACSSVNAFAAGTTAADTRARVTYSGNGTSSDVTVENAENLDAFKNLMPNGTTKPQDIVIQNQSSQKMKVFFQAKPSGDDAAKLLDALQLKITFRLDSASPLQTLYEGSASGKTESSAVFKEIYLGTMYQNSESGVLSAVLTAPEAMGNEYQNARTEIKWLIRFELDGKIQSIPQNNGGGGGGGGGGTPIQTESIGAEATPQAGPTVSTPPEEIPEEEIPLSKPPKTGQDSIFLWVALAAAMLACLVFIVARGRIKHGA